MDIVETLKNNGIEPEKEYTIYRSRVGGEQSEETFLGKNLPDNYRQLIIADEYKKCLKSHYYFATNYLYIEGADGIKRKFTTEYSEEDFNSLCIPTLVRKKK